MTNKVTSKPEVGKMYIQSENLGKNYARECLYVNENGFLLGTNAVGIPSFFFEHRRFKEFVEYKLPVIHKRYLCWFRYKKDINIRCDVFQVSWNELGMNENWTLLSETEVTYEEK